MKTYSVTFDITLQDEVHEAELGMWIEAAVTDNVIMHAGEGMGNLEVREVAE